MQHKYTYIQQFMLRYIQDKILQWTIKRYKFNNYPSKLQNNLPMHDGGQNHGINLAHEHTIGSPVDEGSEENIILIQKNIHNKIQLRNVLQNISHSQVNAKEDINN